jgi:chaperonin GroES
VAQGKKKTKPVKKAAKKPAKKVVKKLAAKKSPKTLKTKKSLKAAPAKKNMKKVAAKKPAASQAKAQRVTKTIAPIAKQAPKRSEKTSRSTINLKNFFTPLDDRLILQTPNEEDERMTPGGLYIPATVSDVTGHLEGLVLATGRGHRDKKGRIKPMDVKVGDRVVFSEYAGNKMEIQGENVVIVRESDIMGILEPTL